MDYDYYKYHALGNDYIVIDPQKNSVELNEHNIQVICHRNFGVGSDGILYGPIFDKERQISLRIFNPDGSEAEKSGNGVREFARYLFDAKYVQTDSFSIKTLGGIVNIKLLDEQADLIKVTMGSVTFVSEEIPTKFTEREAINRELNICGKKYIVNCVSIGNPHCVVPIEKVSREETEKIGPILENHKMFPNKINVQFLEILDRNNIKIEIWERGAGYTLASGTSSCAAASVAHKLGLVDRNVDVHMPGGVIHIDINESWNIDMTGAVTAVGFGNFAKGLLNQKI